MTGTFRRIVGEGKMMWQMQLFEHAQQEFWSSGDPAALESAIAAVRRAHEQAIRLNNDEAAIILEQGMGSLAREHSYFQQDRDAALEDVDQAIRLLKHVANRLSHDPLYRGVALVDLGAAHLRRYELTLEVAEVEMADAVYQRALREPTLSDANRSTCQVALADLSHELFERLGQAQYLDATISAATAALDAEATTPDHRFETRCVLADALVDQVEFKKELGAADRSVLLAQLDRAVALYDDLLAHPPTLDINRELPRLRGNLAYALRVRYEMTGDTADLHRQITLLEQTLNDLSLPGAADPPDARQWAALRGKEGRGQ